MRQSPITLWIDADACPVVVRKLVLKQAERTATSTIFVANHTLPLPRLPMVQQVTVTAGFDQADDYIAAHVSTGDIVVTADIVLADTVISQGARVVTPHGKIYEASNIKPALNARDLMDTLRGTGVLGGGQKTNGRNAQPQQAAYNNQHKQAFANVLNAWLNAAKSTH